MVRRNPSSKEVLASKPKRVLALETSRHRRGWPSGLEGSQRISPGKPVNLAISLGQILDRDLRPTAEIDRIGLVVMFRRQQNPLGGVGGVDELARSRPVPQHSIWSAPASTASTHFLIRAGITWLLAGSKLSPRAVEIHRQQEDRIEAVLLPVRLRLHQQHLLGQAVRGVGLLRVAVPEVVLLERAPA